MKMLTTQIGGLFQRISQNNEESIEETARLLAQATFGEGRVILATFDEFEAIHSVAQNSVEPFTGTINYTSGMSIGTEDRVWILTRSATDRPALELAHSLVEQFIPFAAVAAENSEDNELTNLATTYISTGVTRGLLPGDDGKRYVQPHSLAGLFIYEAVKIAYDEMLADN